MTTFTHIPGLGVDVAKDWLDIFDGKELIRLANSNKAILGFLRSREPQTPIAIESTGRYHECFLELALQKGHPVYMIDAFRLARYRDGIGIRAKTDAADAQVLYRYLCAELPRLRPYQAPPRAVKCLITLLQARSKLIQSRSQLKQSLDNIAELAQTRKSLLARLDRAIALIEDKLQRYLSDAGYLQDYERCIGIPGVGPTNAAALVAFYHRGVFKKVDSFIAFLGLDVRVRESGRFRGKRKLSKRGNPEIRRLLFNAARSGSRTSAWNATYRSLRERGLSTTAATVVISRKIAKLAYALMRDQSEYRMRTT